MRSTNDSLTMSITGASNLNMTSTNLVPEIDIRTSSDTIIATISLSVVMLVGLIGNTSTIIVILLFKSMRKEHSNMLIINLCITDLSNTLLIMFSALVSLVADRWPFGSVWCDCVCFINYCLIIVSMLTLCSISIDRYQAVVHPMLYLARVSRKKMMLVIVYTWIQGIAFGLIPSLLGWVSYDYWEAICAIQWHLYRPSSLIYVIVAFVMCFFGPGSILAYCYIKILREVKKQKNQVQTGNLPQMDRSAKQRKRKLSQKTRIVWSLLVVVFAYFICMTPFSVTKLIKVSINNADEIVPGRVNLMSSLLGYIASAINPLVYGIFRKDFRCAYKQLGCAVFSRRCKSHFNDSKLELYRENGLSVSRDGENVTINQTTMRQLSICDNQGTELPITDASSEQVQPDLIQSEKISVIDNQISERLMIVKEIPNHCQNGHTN